MAKTMTQALEEMDYINCPWCGRKIMAVWMEDYKNIYGCAHCHLDVTIEMDKKFEEDFQYGH